MFIFARQILFFLPPIFFFLSYTYIFLTPALLTLFLLTFLSGKSSRTLHLLLLVSTIFSLTGLICSHRDSLYRPEKAKISENSSPGYRENFIDFIEKNSDSKLIAALSAGKKNFTSREKNIFLKSGTMHIVAISAFHIGVLFLFFEIIRKLMLGFSNINPMSIIIYTNIVKFSALTFYIYITGFSIPTVRAAIFIFTFDIFLSFSIRLNLLYLYLLSLIATSLLVPASLKSYSFLMSSIAVFTVISVWKKLPASAAVRIISLSAIISFIFIPISVHLSGYVSLFAPISNLIIIPYAFILVLLSLIIQLSYILSNDLVLEVLKLSEPFFKIAELNIEIMSNYSSAFLIPGINRPLFTGFFFYMIFFLMFFIKGLKRVFLLSVLLTLSFSYFIKFGKNSFVIKRLYSLPGKAYCIPGESGNGSIIETKRYYYPYKKLNSKIDKIPLYLEKELADCGITKVSSIHLKKRLPHKVMKELYKRKRFKFSKLYIIDNDSESIEWSAK